jgi:branched-chain amino acid transport system permease protein
MHLPSLSRLTLFALVAIVIGCALPFVASRYILDSLTAAFYLAVFAMAWDLLFGFAGEVNFGPTFLIGLGAYTAAILDNSFSPGISVWVCVLAGTAMAVVGGVVLAVPALRVRGPYFGLTTLVAVLMMRNLITIFSDLTGGEIGLSMPDVITVNGTTNYWIAFVFMVVSGAILYRLSRSAIGLVLQASGQDPVQSASLGFNVVKHKLVAFIISAFFSGLAGALLVFYMGTASIGAFVDLPLAVQVIIAAVLGGRRTVIGAALGAIFLIGMGELLRPAGQLAAPIVSAVALLVVLFFPDGFLGIVRGKVQG